MPGAIIIWLWEVPSLEVTSMEFLERTVHLPDASVERSRRYGLARSMDSHIVRGSICCDAGAMV